MRKIVCILMSAIMIFSLCVTSYAVEVTIEDQPLIVNDEKTLLVNAYCGAINERNYPAIVNMSPISIRQLMSSIYSNELNEENKVGLFNINSIVADSIQWGMATALQDYLPAETIDAYPDYDVALVKASIDYEVEDIGIHDGVNYLCVIVVEDADGKYIADVLHIDKSYAEQISSDAAASLGIDTPISANILFKPETIKVYRANQYSGEDADVLGTVETVPFDEYCYICLESVFNFDEVETASREAVAIAVKCFAFHRCLYRASLSLGYHLIDSGSEAGDSGDFLAPCYNPTKTPSAKTINAVDNTWNYYVLDANNRIIPTFHYKSSRAAGGQYGGRLRQYGAEYLAESLGYTRNEILHYYYDKLGSSYYNPEVANGAISVHTHSISVVSTTASQHVVRCNSCGNTHTGAHEFSDYSMKCLICNYRP